MSLLAAIAFGLLMVFAIGWAIYDFFSNLRDVIAPDNADRDRINGQLGEGTPEARAALEKRFGPGGYWWDAATGVGGIAGLAILYGIWFA